jgi:hypothetical protein
MVDAETKPAMSVMGETRRTRCGVTWGYLACYSLGAVRHCQMRPITLPQTFIHVSVRAFHAMSVLQQFDMYYCAHAKVLHSVRNSSARPRARCRPACPLPIDRFHGE